MCQSEVNTYQRQNLFYISLSTSSNGKELIEAFKKELEVREGVNVTAYSRQECCKAFDVEDCDGNIKVLEEIIAKLPDSSVAMFDEVPVNSCMLANRKASYDWSTLENRRAPHVSVVICLQPIMIKSTYTNRAHQVKGPEGADVIELVKQFRSSTRILGFVNQLCREDLPLEYTNLEASPSHEVEGPQVTVLHITEHTDIPAFRAWLVYQFNKLACTPADVKIISAIKSEKLTSVFDKTDWQQSLMTLAEFQGCETLLAVVLFPKDNKDNFSDLMEMASRAQMKLILVVQDNQTLLDYMDQALLVTDEDMMSLYRSLVDDQKTLVRDLEVLICSVNDLDKAVSSYTNVGELLNTEDGHMDKFLSVFSSLTALVPELKALQGRGQKSLQNSVQVHAAEIRNKLNSLESLLDTTVNMANETKKVLEFHKRAEYFRSIGKVKEAEAIQQEMKQMQMQMQMQQMQIQKQMKANLVFLDITRGSTPLGRITVQLHTEAAPETCETFRLLCTGERGRCYKGDTFYYANSSCVRGGRDTGGDAGACPGERGKMREYGPGVLAMDTDGSWFYIYIGEPVLWDRIVLGGRVVNFGKVIEGMDVVRKIRGDDIIQNCGQL